MTQERSNLVGIGLYTIPEASKLSGLSSAQIRRWLLGYSFSKKSGEKVKMSSLWKPDLPNIDGQQGLSFKDLIEIRFIHAFRKYGVGWKIIRAAANYAADEIGQNHPFSSKKFKTDGKRIFAEFAEKVKEEGLLDTYTNQFAFHKIISPSLFASMEFDSHNQAARWFPAHPKKLIVIDPKRSFGKPILTEEGVPTQILAAALKVEGSIKNVAKIYEVKPASVKAAAEYEKRLAA